MKRLVVLLAVLVAIPVVFVAVQLSIDDDGREVNRHWATLEDFGNRAQTGGDTELRASSFTPVFNKIRARRLRASVTAMLGGPQVATLDFGALRRAETENGTDLWLVSSADIHCLVVGLGLGVSCTPTGSAQRKGITVGLTKALSPAKASRLFLLTGMVPDGVRAVRLRVGMRTFELAVKNNTFEYRAHQPIQVHELVQH